MADDLEEETEILEDVDEEETEDVQATVADAHGRHGCHGDLLGLRVVFFFWGVKWSGIVMR